MASTSPACARSTRARVPASDSRLAENSSASCSASSSSRGGGNGTSSSAGRSGSGPLGSVSGHIMAGCERYPDPVCLARPAVSGGVPARQTQEGGLVEHGDAELQGALVLRARALPAHEVVGLGAHRGGHAAALVLDQALGLGARERGERARDHQRLAGEGPAGGAARLQGLDVDAAGLEAREELLVARLAEPARDAAGHLRADALELEQLLLARRRERVERRIMPREQARRGRAHLRDRERDQEAVEGHLARLLQLALQVLDALLAPALELEHLPEV